jgi:type II secretory pathway component GspD/PulD (secretin)
LSVPRVTTLNNSPAKLRSGEDLYYFNKFQAQALQLLDDNNKRFTLSVLIPDGEPKLEELGVTLVAVPSVGANRRSISLLLTPTISRLEGFVSYQEEESESATFADVQQVVAKLPIFSRREIQTKLVVESGETVVLGGLIDTVSQETIHRVPLLGSLPWVGAAFRRTDVTEENKNLLVFVTATVISERGESMRAGPTGAPAPLITSPPVP